MRNAAVGRASKLLLAAAIVVASGSGCQGTGFPRLFSREPVPYQQQRAQKFDPYPEYGPDIRDTRPRAYTNPPPEASRGRWQEWGAPRYGYP